jgi:hypothetical protein
MTEISLALSGDSPPKNDLLRLEVGDNREAKIGQVICRCVEDTTLVDPIWTKALISKRRRFAIELKSSAPTQQ